MSYNNYNGWLFINKPIGVTSTKIVSEVKKNLKVKKVGHAGTLDPLASGVLPIAIGEATKTVNYIFDRSKEYKFTIKFGASTTSCDAEGDILETSDVMPSYEQIIGILPEFTGKIKQIPPIFSAIKVNGKRAYDLARKGKDVKLEARNIDIYSLEMLDFNAKAKEVTFLTLCSKGTYVRSLGRDIAEKLGSKGHISYLQRTKVGKFGLNDTILLEKLNKTVYKGGSLDILTAVEDVLDDIPVFNCTSEEAKALGNGRKVNCTLDNYSNNQIIKALFNNKLVALAVFAEGVIKPQRVFNF